MRQLIRRELNGRVAVIAHSTRNDGDLSPSNVASDVLAQRRNQAVSLPWQAVHQVHSDRVIMVSSESSGEPGSARRPVADGLVTDQVGVALAVHSGDCVPVGFVSDAGIVAAAHAGWKGLEAGVLESTVRQLRSLAPSAAITAVVGPHIRAAEYEFGDADLQRLAARFGDDVVAETKLGTPALDLTAALSSELEQLETTVAAWSPDCTASDHDQYWSHRARQESGRIALVAWLEDSP